MNPTDLRSALIVSHRVRPAASLTDKSRANLLDYNAREGRFGQEKGELEGLLDYNAREGDFSGKRRDAPLVIGDVSGGFFGQEGDLSREEVERALRGCNSHVVTSVVAVRREDAAALRLRGKRDFEDLLRRSWAEHVDLWGVIDRGSARWAASFHADNAANVHVHVITWDESGRWDGSHRPVIPKECVLRSREQLRSSALSPLVSDMRKSRAFLRDWAHARLRCDMGDLPTDAEIDRLMQRQTVGTAHFPDPRLYIPVGVDHARKDAISSIVRAMPEGSTSALHYARSSEAVREQVKLSVRSLAQADPHLSQAIDGHESLARREQVALGRDYRDPWTTSPAKKSDVIAKDLQIDFHRRLSNAMLTSVNRELTRTREERTHTRVRNHAHRDAARHDHETVPRDERTDQSGASRLSAILGAMRPMGTPPPADEERPQGNIQRKRRKREHDARRR